MTTICGKCGGINGVNGMPVKCHCHPTTCTDGKCHAWMPLDFTDRKSSCDLLPYTERVVHSLYCTKCGMTMKPVKP